MDPPKSAPLVQWPATGFRSSNPRVDARARSYRYCRISAIGRGREFRGERERPCEKSNSCGMGAGRRVGGIVRRSRCFQRRRADQDVPVRRLRHRRQTPRRLQGFRSGRVCRRKRRGDGRPGRQDRPGRDDRRAPAQRHGAEVRRPGSSSAPRRRPISQPAIARRASEFTICYRDQHGAGDRRCVPLRY